MNQQQTIPRSIRSILICAFLLSLVGFAPTMTIHAQENEPIEQPTAPEEGGLPDLNSLSNRVYLPFSIGSEHSNVPAEIRGSDSVDDLSALATNVYACNALDGWVNVGYGWSGYTWNTVLSGCPNIYVNPSMSGYVQVVYYSTNQGRWVYKPYKWVQSGTWTEMGTNFGAYTQWYSRIFNFSSGRWINIKTTSGRQVTSTPPPANNGLQIDWAFIEQREGNETTGYVPTYQNGQVIGNSGVTIGSGFDLGQHDRAYMERIGIPARLVNILAPYTGHKRQDAVNFLAANPLSLSVSDTRIVNEKVKTDKAQEVIDAYNAASSVPFTSLPKGAQTVIASVAFQYGSLPSATPTFWSHVIRQDWDATISELRNFGDDYASRRNLEADYLENNR